MLDEKALRDRSQFLLGGVLPSNFFRTSGFVNYQGFEGYIGLKARVTKVREIATARSEGTDGIRNKGGIRNDIAETETLESISTSTNGVSLRAGANLGFGLGALTLTPLLAVESSHSASSSVQAQPKTAIVRHGSRRRFEAVLRIDVEVHATPNIVWDSARIARGQLRSESLTAFSVDVPAEILIPETHAQRFLSAISAAAPDHPQPLTEADMAEATEQVRAAGHARFFSLFRQPTAGTMRDWVMRTVPLGHLLLSALDPSPLMRSTPLFPPGGLASETALVAHLAATGDPVALYVPYDYDLEHHFTARQLDSLQALQRAGRLRIFTAPGPDLGSAGVTISPGQRLADEQPEQPGDIPLGQYRGSRIARTPLDQHEIMHSHQPGRGYALNSAGVSHGWHGSAAESNPARAQSRTPAAMQQPADPRAQQVPRTQSAGLLADTDLPDSGVVTNLADVPVWGWVPAGIPEWGAGESDQRRALMGLLSQAGRSGLQLVVDPDSDHAGQLSAAVASLHDLTHDEWREFWERSGGALENHGAGLEGLSRDDLLRVLVTDRSVRIVDENGVVRDELNARLISVSGDGRPNYLTGSVALALGEEFALRADRRFSRSISWNEQGRMVAHVRRAVSPSDPATETPELAAGLGLGTAAVKELPGAEKVHDAVRSLILDMVSNLPLAGPAHGVAPGSGPNMRYARLSPGTRFSLARELQEAFGLPKLRAARGRGLDTHLHKEFKVAGRTYLVDVRAVKLGGDRPDGRSASERATVREPGHADRGYQQTRSELGVAVDHQAKGMRGGGEQVGRSVEAGLEAGGSYRLRTPDPRLAVDVGDFALTGSYTREEFLAIAGANKHYLRLRSQPAEVFRPEYPVRYQITVTEISRSWDHSERTRVGSRLIEPDEASLPAIVHSAFRPAPAIAHDPEYEAAYRDVVATMGRTTVLSEAQYRDLERRRLDFSEVGSAGLNAFVTGLRDAVRQAARLVNEQARDRAAGLPPEPAGSAGYVRTDPAALWDHLPEVDTLVTEGFLRANLPRLLAGEGLPVSLPGEHHRFAGPSVSRSLTMGGFLVPASDAIGHQAPEASNESYVEDDTKITDSEGSAVRGGLSMSLGPTMELGSLSVRASGSGDSADFERARNDPGLEGQRYQSRATGRPGPAGPGSKSGSSLNSRRAVRPRVGLTADASATVNLYSSTRSRTTGTIDLGLLTEPKGQHVTRAHLVLRFDSIRQPGDAGLLGLRMGSQSIAEHFFGTRALSFSRDTAYLLVENAVELYKSDTLHTDLQSIRSGGQGYPAPEGSGPKGKGIERPVVLDDATGYAVGFPLRFDVSRVRFTGQGPRHPDQDLPEATGLIQAIEAGLRATGLVGDEYLNDASDVWRAITARYDAEAVRTHLHDLLGVGIIHRAEIPVNSLLPLAAGRTRRLTIIVVGTAKELRHVRTRANDSVTFGGQALAQHGHDSETSFRGGLSVNLDGRYTANQRSYLETALSVGVDGETSVTTGTEEVVRDIRRSAGSGGSEEFAGELGLKVEIFADTEQIEPLRRAVQYNSWVASLLAQSATADAGPHAPLVTFVSDPSTPATTRLVVPRPLTRLVPPSNQRITPPVLAARLVRELEPLLLDNELRSKLLALQFPGLELVARWAPTTTLPPSLADSHVRRQEPAQVSGLLPTTDQGLRMLQALGNRYVRNNVADLFGQKLSLSSTAGSAITLGARSWVLRRMGPAGNYSGLAFTEEAQEPTVVLGGGLERRVTLAVGGGNAMVLSVPDPRPGAAVRPLLQGI